MKNERMGENAKNIQYKHRNRKFRRNKAIYKRKLDKPGKPIRSINKKSM